jgi:predicted nucleic acid-binding protein
VIVVDASAWAYALIDAAPKGDAARLLLADDPDWLMPAHAPVEVLRTIRRYESAGSLTAAAAADFAVSVGRAECRYAQPEPWLLAAVWHHRHNISPYDAPYVALATRYDVPLITFDLRLAKAARAEGVTVVIPGQA